MSKYDPLKNFLLASTAEEVPMSFDEIEALLGAPLPDSQRYPAWWSNNPSNNVMTRIWLDAGYRSERVDIAGRKLVFRRQAASEEVPGVAEAGQRQWTGGLVERLRKALAGTVRVAPGVDLTEPTGEIWDAASR